MIGAYAPDALWNAAADYQGFGSLPLSEKYRRLLSEGVDAMDERLQTERSSVVLESVLRSVDELNTGKKRQVSIRLEPALYRYAVGISHEYGRSLSELAAGWIASALIARMSVRP